jgi:hypothetical protein
MEHPLLPSTINVLSSLFSFSSMIAFRASAAAGSLLGLAAMNEWTVRGRELLASLATAESGLK